MDAAVLDRLNAFCEFDRFAGGGLRLGERSAMSFMRLSGDGRFGCEHFGGVVTTSSQKQRAVPSAVSVSGAATPDRASGTFQAV